MQVRGRWMFGLVLAMAVPAWAHCGHCGTEKQHDGGDAHAHGQDQGHDHGHGHAHAEIGAPAPAFTLKGVDGKTYKLSDFKGKVVVLEWTNHQCPVVNRYHNGKLPTSTLAKFKDKPVVWVAIDSSYFAGEKVSDIKSWASKNGVSYPILLDPNGAVGHNYAAKTTPHMFVIDQKGKLAYQGSMDNDQYGDKEDGLRNYVEEAVTALLKGSTVARSSTKPFGCSVKYKRP